MFDLQKCVSKQLLIAANLSPHVKLIARQF